MAEDVAEDVAEDGTRGPAPLIVRDMAWPLGAPPQALHALAAGALGLDAAAIAEVRPTKVSLDARGKVPKRIVTAEVWRVGDEIPPEELPRVGVPSGMRRLVPGGAPIIVGTGPAGLWAALRFIEAGQPCVLLERGQPVQTRNLAVRDLRMAGQLDPESNLCFGEGGAGTYSDGKLYTRVRDPRVMRVYRDLVAFGASPEILVQAHPHVGTNRLIKILSRIHAFLAEAGCELRFGARMVGLVRAHDGRVAGVRLADGTEALGSAVVLATGHSARDTYRALYIEGVPIVPKPFAIGVRVEHPQALIDQIQYGQLRSGQRAGRAALGAATYALAAQVGGRGVYSFCMCPGGFVIPTTTEPGQLNVNGMSHSNRGSRWANSALVVTIDPSDFWLDRPGDLDADSKLGGPLAGLALQRALERRAYEAGGGGFVAPAQRLTDFLTRRAGEVPARSSYKPGVAPADLHALLPDRIAAPLARAILRFERRMPGFVTREAMLIAVETTTSSPVRLVRDARTLTPRGFDGLYPTGEGAGYAGGIVSSAIEGLRVAEAVLA